MSGKLILTGKEHILGAFRETYAQVHRQAYAPIGHKVQLIAPDIAIYSALGRGSFQDKDGNVSDPVRSRRQRCLHSARWSLASGAPASVRPAVIRILRGLALLGPMFFPVAAPAQPAQNPVNLFVAELRQEGGTLRLGTPRNLTGDRGRNSQPSFTPDGRAIVFSAVRDTTGQGDVYRIDLESGAETRVTRTMENENSPTDLENGELAAVRWVPATLFTRVGTLDLQRRGRAAPRRAPGSGYRGVLHPGGRADLGPDASQVASRRGDLRCCPGHHA